MAPLWPGYRGRPRWMRVLSSKGCREQAPGRPWVMSPRNRQTLRGASIAAAASAACLLAGCGGGGGSGSPSTGTVSRPSSPAAGSPSPTTQTPGTASPSSTGAGANTAPSAQARLLRAGATAEHAVAYSTLISIETEAGGKQWKAQVVTGDGTEHEVRVSRSGDNVVTGPTTKHEGAQDKAQHRRRVNAAKLNYRQATHKIAAAVSGGRITELNLDTYRGTTVWEADVIASGTKHSVKLDAKTGKVLVDKTGEQD